MTYVTNVGYRQIFNEFKPKFEAAGLTPYTPKIKEGPAPPATVNPVPAPVEYKPNPRPSPIPIDSITGPLFALSASAIALFSLKTLITRPFGVLSKEH